MYAHMNIRTYIYIYIYTHVNIHKHILGHSRARHVHMSRCVRAGGFSGGEMDGRGAQARGGAEVMLDQDETTGTNHLPTVGVCA